MVLKIKYLVYIALNFILLVGLNSCVSISEFQKLENLLSSKEFERIPPRYQRPKIYDDIVPNEKYEFWQIRTTSGYDGEHSVLVEQGYFKGNRTSLDSIRSDFGFFIECHPGFCYTYVIAEYSRGMDTIVTEQEFRDFVGSVDNLGEAILIGKSYDYWYDTKDPRGGSYYETPNEFLLKLLRFESTPHTWYTVNCIIDKKTGSFVEINQVKYKSENIWSMN